ncbi:MAG: family 43 glycosylhydrolase [Oscillospiraceae bacterium]|nr:family 43 glycosylhydrolase [Oscillospiraceae bacterium]
METKDIKIRDPYVLVHEGQYFLYGTRSETAFFGQAYGFDVYVSCDLKNWEGPFEVFHRPDNFWSRKSYWAPEVYFYGEQFYMFATFADEKKGLGTAVLISDSPMGPFHLWSDGYATPKNWRCLDGTLHIAKDGTPYMVFCHEWRQIHDGTICAIEMSKDLKKSIGEPWKLFSASQAEPFVKKYFFRNYITDGPFLIRTQDGVLHMLWSTSAKTGYVEAVAHSDTNELLGNWTIEDKPIYDHDGGHGMIFEDLSGRYWLVLHYPNTFGKEHPRFMELEYNENGHFAVIEKP